jgi:hypothetical protein
MISVNRKALIAHDLLGDNVWSAEVIWECLLEARMNGAFNLRRENEIRDVDQPN